MAAALEGAVDREGVRLLLTTGDNIYAGRTLLGIPVGATGDEDDDWFFTFYQPYRYLINRIPVYPSIGNHDGNETEINDDRDQIMDNFYLMERLMGEEAAGRASIGPGLFYRFRFGSQIELVCLDTSRRSLLSGHEHNFQHARVDGIDYFVTGGGGKVRTGRPDGFTAAGTRAWAPVAHFLLVRIEGTRADVTAVGEDGRPLPALDPSGQPVAAHTVIEL